MILLSIIIFVLGFLFNSAIETLCYYMFIGQYKKNIIIHSTLAIIKLITIAVCMHINLNVNVMHFRSDIYRINMK